MGILEYFEKLGVKYPETLIDDWDVISGTRRPLMFIRGKSITKEQVMDILINEEPLFSNWDKNDLYTVKQPVDPRCQRGILKNIFYRTGYDWLDTWLFEDGHIGGNVLDFKYPELDESLTSWVEFATRRNDLDMIVSWTTINETTCNYCPLVDKFSNEDSQDKQPLYGSNCDSCKKWHNFVQSYWSSEYKHGDFEYACADCFGLAKHPDNESYYVAVTLWIHNGTVEILTGKNAKDKFVEYDKLYSIPNNWFLYEGCIIKRSCIGYIISSEFIKECFVKAGLPEECYDISIKNKFISEAKGCNHITTDWYAKQISRLCSTYKIE